MTGQSHSKSSIGLIFFTIFLDMLGIGILIPVIPQLLTNPASPHYLLASGMSVDQGYIMLGLLTASYPLAQFFASPILGQISDRYGRKPVLTAALANTCVSYALFAYGILTRNIPLLFVARVLDGVGGGSISVSQAAIADITTPENRAKNFGLIGAAFGLGFIMGPFIGGKLADPSVLSWFNASTPFWFAAALAGVNALSIAVRFRETNAHRTTGRLTWGKGIKNIVSAFTHPGLRSLFVTGFLFQGGFSFFTTFFGVFLIQRFAFSEGGIGDFFAFVGIWIVFTQAVVTRKVAARWSETQVLRVSMVLMAAFLLCFVVSPSWWWLYAFTPFFSMFNGLTQANFMGLLSRSADQRIQGEVMGINTSVTALAQTIPPVLSGFIAAASVPATPVYIAAGIAALAWVYFIASRPRRAVV